MTRRIPRKQFSVASDKDQDAVAARLESSRARVKETPISENGDAKPQLLSTSTKRTRDKRASIPSRSSDIGTRRRHVSIRVSVSLKLDQDALAWCKDHRIDTDYLRKSMIAKTRSVFRDTLSNHEEKRFCELTDTFLALPAKQRVLWKRTTISLSEDEFTRLRLLCGDVLGSCSDMLVCSAVFCAILQDLGLPEGI